MTNAIHTALLGAPYRPPRPFRGRVFYDILRGDVVADGVTESPIAWPVARTSRHARRAIPVMSDELVRAVRTESVEGIVHHWGVSRWTVRRWRHALGVPRYNPGTMALWRSLAPKLHDPAVQARAVRAWRALAAQRRRAKGDVD
jgi:hypothetical protein